MTPVKNRVPPALFTAREAVVHLNFRAGSTFPVPVCTVPSSIDRTSRCNKVDVVRLYASYRLNLLLLKGRSAWLFIKKGLHQILFTELKKLPIHSVNIQLWFITWSFSIIQRMLFVVVTTSLQKFPIYAVETEEKIYKIYLFQNFSLIAQFL